MMGGRQFLSINHIYIILVEGNAGDGFVFVVRSPMAESDAPEECSSNNAHQKVISPFRCPTAKRWPLG
jgi:hypothetical protein